MLQGDRKDGPSQGGRMLLQDVLQAGAGHTHTCTCTHVCTHAHTRSSVAAIPSADGGAPCSVGVRSNVERLPENSFNCKTCSLKHQPGPETGMEIL